MPMIAALNALGNRWIVGVGIAAAIDGAFLGGVAAIISAIGTLVLGILAYLKGLRAGKSSEAEAWRLLAEARERELEQIRRDDAE